MKFGLLEKLLLVAAVLLGSASVTALAYETPDPNQRIVNQSLEATRYTGWIPVSTVARMVYQGVWVDGNGSVTEIDMKCWTSDTTRTSNGDGFPVSIEFAADEATGKALHKQYQPYWEFAAGNTKFEFVVVHPLGLYMNCGFLAGAGSPGSTDKLTVNVRGEER
jgi:hypothetical protein